MRPLNDGYTYKLDSTDGGRGQTLQFVEKWIQDAASKDMKVAADGTTTEDVLRVIIHRLTTLNKELPSTFNLMAIDNCEKALDCLNRRTEDRGLRGVRGKFIE